MVRLARVINENTGFFENLLNNICKQLPEHGYDFKDLVIGSVDELLFKNLINPLGDDISVEKVYDPVGSFRMV